MPDSYFSRFHVSGELVPKSGLYVALHPSGAVSYGNILFDRGERFPLCSRCNDVRYTPLRSIPPKLRLRKPKKSQMAIVWPASSGPNGSQG
jgi:hypothetical protein